MDMLRDSLKELGLKNNEINVYLALLKKNKSSVIEIATESKVHRVSVYAALNKLMSLGLASFVIAHKKRHFLANKPESLITLAKLKEEKIASALPQLKALQEKAENQAQVFEGLEGIKFIIRDMVEEGKDIKAFGIPKILPELLKNFLVGFHRDRIAKKIQIDHIYNENARERIAWLNKIKYSKARYLPKEYTVPATTLIYGNKTAFWVWSDIPFSVLIESEKMANTYRKYFELLWNLAK